MLFFFGNMLQRLVIRSKRLPGGSFVVHTPEIILGRCPPLCITDKRCGRTQIKVSLDCTNSIVATRVRRVN